MIPIIYRANFGYLLRHPWQLALAVLGIGIGVAVIVAVDLANTSARKAFELSMDAVSGAATHQIIGGPRGVDEGLYTRLRVDHGIRGIAPVVGGSVDIDERSVQLLGVDLFAERAIRDFTRAIEPHATVGKASSLFRDMLTEPGAVLMSRHTAELFGITPGDRFEVIADGRTHDAMLLGTFGAGADKGLDNLVTADIATAQAWLNQPGFLTRIDVRLDRDEAGQRRLRALLPPDMTLLTAAGRTRTTAEMSAAFMTNLTAMSLLALLVGLFLIYNSVSFSVLQRRGLIGVLRAIGVTRRQSFMLILSEAACIGLISAVLGVVVGIWLGEQLLALVSQSINDFYFRVSVTDVSVSPFSIGKGIVAGTAAAVVAAAVPAVEAAAYQPRLAMTRSVLEQRAHRLLPIITIIGLVTIAVSALVLSLSGRNLVAGLTSVFLLIFGFALCVPLAANVMANRLTPLGRRMGSMPVQLAVSGISASLSRTGVAIVALAIAVSATIGVSVMVDSFRGSVSAWLTQTLQADLYVGVRRGTLDAALISDLVAVPGIDDFSTSRRAWLESESGRTRIHVIKMAPASYRGVEILDADPEAVWRAFDNEDAVLVSEPYAYQNDVRIDTDISLRTAAGIRNFRVVATYQSYDINATALLMSRATYDRHWDDPGIDSIGLYLPADSAVEDVVAGIESVNRSRQQLVVSSSSRIRDLSLEIFDRTFIITDVLYWLAIGVALIGILGAMLALQLERAREFATLRALGMTQLQLGGMIMMQTGLIGLMSGLAAIPLGLVMAYVLIEVINRRAFGWHIDMAIAPGILVSAVFFAIVAALIAGIYPAYRSAMSQPALAMREE